MLTDGLNRNSCGTTAAWLLALGLLALVVPAVPGCASDEHRPPPATVVQTSPPPGPAASPAAIRTVAYVAADAPPAGRFPDPAVPATERLPAPLPSAGGALPPAGANRPEAVTGSGFGAAVGVPAGVPAGLAQEPQVPTVTLSQAMAITLQSDPKLRGALEAVHQSEGDLLTSSLPPNPTLQLNGVYLPLRPFTPTQPGGPPELDVIGTYPIDWFIFGKRAAAVADAQNGVAVSNADYCDQVRQRLANTASAFYDVLEARAMLQLAEEDLANLQRVERITREGVRLGGSGTIEAERVRLSELAAEDDACTRATTLATAKAQFRAAIGYPRHCLTDLAGSLDVPRPAAPLPLAEAIVLAERNRPDIISLRRQIDKARSSIAVEHSKARPQLTPGFGYSYQWQNDDGAPDAPSYSAQMAVTVPLFDRNQGNIAKAESVLAQSYFNLQAQLVQTEADVEQADGEFEDAAESVTRLGPAQLAAARSVRDRTVTAYGLGGKTLLDVLDAERAYRDTHRTYILNQSRYWHTLHRLNAAVGQEVLQ